MPPGLFVARPIPWRAHSAQDPKAKVVKALNTVSNVHMVDPRMKGGAPMMFIAGDDAREKKVEAILKDFGWAGPTTSAELRRTVARSRRAAMGRADAADRHARPHAPADASRIQGQVAVRVDDVAVKRNRHAGRRLLLVP